MKFIKFLFLFILSSCLFLGTAFSAYAQENELVKPITTKTDTIIQKPSKNANLQSEVKYNAEDSIRIDKKNSIIYLYGKARIIYTDFELDADYIRYDQKTIPFLPKANLISRLIDIKADQFLNKAATSPSPPIL